MRKLRRSRFGLVLVAAIVVAFVAAPASALAQDSLSNPSQAQYKPPNLSGVGSGGAAASDASDSGGLNSQLGQLPFTGMDLIILAGVALMLMGTGLALRRLSMPRQQP